MRAEHATFDRRFEPSPLAERVTRGWLEDNLGSERARIVVAEEEGAVVGYAFGAVLENPPIVPQQFFGHVWDCVVAPERRRRGVGARLSGALHEWFRSKGLPYAQLNVAVRNDAARAFWRRLGYGDYLEQLRMEL